MKTPKMKTILFFLPAMLCLFSSDAKATSYRILKVDLKTDSSLGTFISSSTVLGAIIGVGYVLEATTGTLKTSFSSDFWLNSPQLSLPSLTNLKTAIRNDATSKNAKARMDSDLIKAAVDAQPFIPVLGEDPGL